MVLFVELQEAVGSNLPPNAFTLVPFKVMVAALPATP